MKSKYKQIIEYLENGVPLNDGNVRNFDIIDYYFITNLSYNKVFEKLKNKLSLSQIKMFKKFCTNNPISMVRTIDNCESLLDIFLTVGVEFDDNGNLIEGSGKTVTYEDNIKIVNFLVSHNIPLCLCTMNSAQRRFLNNDLEIGERKLIKK